MLNGKNACARKTLILSTFFFLKKNLSRKQRSLSVCRVSMREEKYFSFCTSQALKVNLTDLFEYLS